jgi:hypothetical protein
MLETYFMREKEWPDTKLVGTLVLPSSKNSDVLSHVYIQKWDFDELKVTCTKNIMDMLSVDALVSTKNGYSFAGDVYKFEAPIEFYRERFDEILHLN